MPHCPYVAIPNGCAISLCHVAYVRQWHTLCAHKAYAYMPTVPTVQLTWPYRPLHRQVRLACASLYMYGPTGLYFRLPIDLRSIRPTVAYGYIGYIRSLRMFSNVCDVVCTCLLALQAIGYAIACVPQAYAYATTSSGQQATSTLRVLF